MQLLRGVYTLGFTIFLPAEHAFAFHDMYLHQFTVHDHASSGGVVHLGLHTRKSSPAPEPPLLH